MNIDFLIAYNQGSVLCFWNFDDRLKVAVWSLLIMLVWYSVIYVVNLHDKPINLSYMYDVLRCVENTVLTTDALAK